MLTRIFLLISFFLLGSPLRAGAPQPINVMSFNIRVPVDPEPNDWNNRRQRVSEVIRRYQADIVGLQESDPGPTFDLLAETGLALATGTNTGILYAPERLRPLETGVFFYSDTPDIDDGRLDWGQEYARRCVWVLFEDLQSGRWFYVYNNHWSYVASAWQKSAALLAERVAARRHPDVPFLLLGDFNVPEGDASLNELIYGPIIRVEDTFRRRWPQRGQDGTYHGFQGRRDSGKIDFIFAQSQRFLFFDAGIIHDEFGGLYPSDHFPIFARIFPN